MNKKIAVEKINQLTGHKASIFTIGAYQSSTAFLSGAGEGWAVAWDIHQVDKGQLVAEVEGNIFSSIYLQAQNYLLLGNMYGNIYWIDLGVQKAIKNTVAHQRGVFDILSVAPYIYTVGGDGNLLKWQHEPQIQLLEILDLSNHSLRTIRYLKHRAELVIGGSDRMIHILDAQTMELKQQIIEAHRSSVFNLAISPCERYLLSGGRDAKLKIWDIEQNYALFKSIPAHLYTINHILYHPLGKCFATASRDKSIKIWDAESFDLLKVITFEKYLGHSRSVNKLYWLPDPPHYLVSASDDQSLIIWQVNLTA